MGFKFIWQLSPLATCWPGVCRAGLVQMNRFCLQETALGAVLEAPCVHWLLHVTQTGFWAALNCVCWDYLLQGTRLTLVQAQLLQALCDGGLEARYKNSCFKATVTVSPITWQQRSAWVCTVWATVCVGVVWWSKTEAVIQIPAMDICKKQWLKNLP